MAHFTVEYKKQNQQKSKNETVKNIHKCVLAGTDRDKLQKLEAITK